MDVLFSDALARTGICLLSRCLTMGIHVTIYTYLNFSARIYDKKFYRLYEQLTKNINLDNCELLRGKQFQNRAS
jgi:hypothetical protein